MWLVLSTLVCPISGRAHPNTDKWPFQKWCWEVSVEEVLTANPPLPPKPPVFGDKELNLYSNPFFGLIPG